MLTTLVGEGAMPIESLYRLVVEGPAAALAAFREDASVPIAAAHPALRFTLEWCDEFGSVGGRARYASGEQLESERVDPLELEWVEWEEAEE